MKKCYITLFSFAVLHFAASAQVISGAFPAIGDAVQLSSNFGITEAGDSGFGITWDFSQAAFGEEYTLNVISTEDALMNELFPDATAAFSFGFGSGDVTFYNFVDFAGGNWADHGTVGFGAGNEMLSGIVFSDPRVLFTTPLTTTSNGGDNYAGTVEIPFQAAANLTGSSEWIVDGSGTLILPNMTYTNVLRVRNEAQETLSFSGIPLSFESTTINHIWLVEGIPYPLLITTTTIEDLGGEIEETFEATALVSFSGGVNAVIDKDGLNSMYAAIPNPFTNVVRITAIDKNQVISTITITDLNGRSVKNIEVEAWGSNSDAELDLSELNAGIYLAHIEHNFGSSFLRIVKAH